MPYLDLLALHLLIWFCFLQDQSKSPAEGNDQPVKRYDEAYNKIF